MLFGGLPWEKGVFPTIRRSLQQKYVTLLTGLIGAALLTSGAVGTFSAYRDAMAAVASAQRGQAHRTALAIAVWYERLRDNLAGSFNKFETNSDAVGGGLQLELASLMRHHPEFADLRWFDGSCKERLALTRFGLPAVDAGVGGRSTSAGCQARLLQPETAVVHFHQDSEPYLSMGLSRGPNSGTLLAQVDLRVLHGLMVRTRERGEGLVYVVDETGHLLAHPDLGQVLAKTRLDDLPQVQRALADRSGGPATGAGRDRTGGELIASTFPVGGLPWTVVIEQSADDALQPVHQTLWRSVLLLLIGLAVAVVASIVFARRLVRPIREIEAGARRMAEGRFGQRIDVPTGDELQHLAEQFNGMARRLHEIHLTQESRIAERTGQLAQANATMSRFLAAAAHDLRQPVHALALFVDQLRQQALAGTAATLALRIEQSLRGLQTLIGSLLDLSRLDAGAVQTEVVDFALQTLLDSVALQAAPSAAQRGLRMRVVPTTAWVRSDPALLERIVVNLVSNALRYTEHGGVVVGARRRGPDIELMVVDSGVGIEAHQQARVFDEFYRGAPARNDERGQGLGLSIVRRLAQLLHHPLSLRSAPGRGTAIGVRVPRVEAARPSSTADALPPDALQGCQVLVVDDDEQALEAVRRTVLAWGCQVAVARSAAQTLEQARQRWPDLVLCDLGLADGETGLDVLRQLGQAGGRLPGWAFVTGGGADEHLAQARASGHPVLLKPVAPARLRAMMEHLLMPDPETSQPPSIR